MIYNSHHRQPDFCFQSSIFPNLWERRIFGSAVFDGDILMKNIP